MKNTSGVALLFFLALIIAIFQLVQNRHALPIRAAATPSVTVTSFLVTANSPTATITETPTLIVSAMPTFSPTLPSEPPTAPYTPTKSPPFQSPIPTPTTMPDLTSGNYPPVTHHNAFNLPNDRQNDIDWITTAIEEYLNSGGDPWRIVDAFQLLHRDDYLRVADLEGDNTMELLLQVSTLLPDGRHSYLGFLDCSNGQYNTPQWIIEASSDVETHARFTRTDIADIVDLNQDGIQEVIVIRTQTLLSTEGCQKEVMVYWQTREIVEILTTPTPICSPKVFVIDPVEGDYQTILIEEIDNYAEATTYSYFWESTQEQYNLKNMGVNAPFTREPLDTLPLLPSSITVSLQDKPHCPATQPIDDFWLVLSADENPYAEEQGYAPQMVAALNAGVAPEALHLLLARHHQSEGVRRIDFNNDGVDELVFFLKSPGWHIDHIALFVCTMQGTYEFKGWLLQYADAKMVVVEDFNHDGYLEILIELMPLANDCLIYRDLLGWDGTILVSTLLENGGNKCSSELTMTDLDQDGFNEWVIHGYDDRHRHDWTRQATWIYKLTPITEIDTQPYQDQLDYKPYQSKLPETGLVYALSSKVLDPPTDRVHVLEDASTALENGDRQLAITLYEQAITDLSFSFQPEIEKLLRQLQGNDLSDAVRESRQDWYDVLVQQEPYTLAFAYLRLILLYVGNGDTSQADYWLDQMLVRFPDGVLGSELRTAAETFMHEWKTTNSITNACDILETQHRDAYQTLDGVLARSRPYINLQHLCPFTK